VVYSTPDNVQRLFIFAIVLQESQAINSWEKAIMDVETIIQEIKAGLTGDPQTDAAYLQKQAYQYRDHPYGKEIARACGRLLYELIPQEKRAPFERAVSDSMVQIQEKLDQIQWYMNQKAYADALLLMDSWVKDLDNNPIFTDDSATEYRCFHEPLEKLLYQVRHRSGKVVRDPGVIPYDRIYLQYGQLLLMVNRLDDARHALEKAVYWCPASCPVKLAYADILHKQKDWETFFQVSLDAFHYAFMPQDLAYCYRNIADYFLQKNQYAEAMGCLYMSLQYNPEWKSEIAHDEIVTLYLKTDGKPPVPSEKEMAAYSKQYEFPLGADPELMQVAYVVGTNCQKQGDRQAALYFFTILERLTNDEKVKKTLEQLKQETSG